MKPWSLERPRRFILFILLILSYWSGLSGTRDFRTKARRQARCMRRITHDSSGDSRKPDEVWAAIATRPQSRHQPTKSDLQIRAWETAGREGRAAEVNANGNVASICQGPDVSVTTLGSPSRAIANCQAAESPASVVPN